MSTGGELIVQEITATKVVEAARLLQEALIEAEEAGVLVNATVGFAGGSSSADLPELNGDIGVTVVVPHVVGRLYEDGGTEFVNDRMTPPKPPTAAPAPRTEPRASNSRRSS